jgi:hemerythrin-like domain-containing protein
MASWADQPFPLIPIKSVKLSASPDALYIAGEMDNVDNGLIRSLNSMYLQASYVTEDADIQDLLQFAIFWESWIEKHHLGEEKLVFPDVARIIGQKDIMDTNIERHHAFLSGMQGFLAYVKECKNGNSVEKYDRVKFMQLIDSFGPLLAKHLADEIETLLELEKYEVATKSLATGPCTGSLLSTNKRCLR